MSMVTGGANRREEFFYPEDWLAGNSKMRARNAVDTAIARSGRDKS